MSFCPRSLVIPGGLPLRILFGAVAILQKFNRTLSYAQVFFMENLTWAATGAAALPIKPLNFLLFQEVVASLLQGGQLALLNELPYPNWSDAQYLSGFSGRYQAHLVQRPS